MFIFKKHLSRRTLLKGIGASVALPLLDSMIPAATPMAQTAAARKLRAGFFYLPHGAIMNNTSHGDKVDKWNPSGSGADFKLNAIMKSLDPYKNYVTTFGNLKNEAMVGGVHSRAPGTWLSATKPNEKAPGASMCTTLDQEIAKKIGQGTTLPSLELASETTIQAAACGGARCYYSSTLSFRDTTSPLPMEFNPRKVFIQLFGEGDTNEERDAVSKQTGSLLDRINERTKALQRDLDAGDRAVLDSYLTTVREIERRLEIAAQRDLSDIKLPAAPIGTLDNFADQVNMMFDLITLAFRADLTRVVSFMMASEGTARAYNHIGVSDAFHPTSHHANQLDRIEKLVKIQTWHMDRFGQFVKNLAAVKEGDSTLLDNSMFLYGSNMSNSDRHNGHPLPTVLVGGGAGRLTGGRHIELPAPTPLGNLHLTILGKAGIEQKSFGDSTGTVAGV
jgi:hypothetical protein